MNKNPLLINVYLKIKVNLEYLPYSIDHERIVSKNSE